MFLVQHPDDDLEAIVDSTLGENMEAFFMGARVVFATKEEDNAFRTDSRLPNMCRKPLVSVTHDLGDLPINVLVYRQRK